MKTWRNPVAISGWIVSIDSLSRIELNLDRCLQLVFMKLTLFFCKVSSQYKATNLLKHVQNSWVEKVLNTEIATGTYMSLRGEATA